MTETAIQIRKKLSSAQAQAKQIQSQLSAIATKTVKPSADVVAEELAAAKLREKNRLEKEALTNAAARLATQKAALEKQLKEVERQEDRVRAEARTDEAIAKIEKLRPELESAVASVLAAMDQLKAIENKYGSDVRENLSYIRADDPHAQRKGYTNDTLLDLEAAVYLPKLVRKNGRDGSPLRYYGDLFELQAEFVNMEKR